MREVDLYTLKKEKVTKLEKELRESLIKNWELTEEKYDIQHQNEGLLKTNETLVEFKNNILQENNELVNKNSVLVSKLSTYTAMSFWKRLVFLFTGKVN